MTKLDTINIIKTCLVKQSDQNHKGGSQQCQQPLHYIKALPNLFTFF